MALFKIIDRETGKEPTDKVITAQARLGNLMTCDIDGFYVGEDGQIILVDDCGNCTWLDRSRFKVEMQNEASQAEEDGSECEHDHDTLKAYDKGFDDGLEKGISMTEPIIEIDGKRYKAEAPKLKTIHKDGECVIGGFFEEDDRK